MSSHPTLDLVPRQTANAKAMRRKGAIPVVMYSRGQPAEQAAINTTQIDALLRNVEQGFLPTTVCILKGEDGRTRRAIVKDIHYHLTTYNVQHVDFLELHEDQGIEVNIPITFTGTVDCVGVKGGGYIRQMMRHLKVRCLPKHMPTHFQLDVKDLDFKQMRRVRDVALPAHVSTLANPEDCIVTVIK